MTSVYKPSISRNYMELLKRFPPPPITNDKELTATQKQINAILDKPQLNQDDRDYLKVLGMLVYDYEETHEPITPLQGAALLRALLEESNCQPQDLIPILGDPATL